MDIAKGDAETMSKQSLVPAPNKEPSLWARHTSINTYLSLLVLACLIPGIIGAIALIWHSNQNSREELERSSIQTARAVMQAVDSQLARCEAVLLGLTTSEAIRRRDFQALYKRMQEIATNTQLVSQFSLTDKNGQLILTTARPFGEPLPKHSNPLHIQKVIQSRQPAISNLFTGAISRDFVVTVDVPVILDGRVDYVVTAVLTPRFLTTLLENQRLPKDWRAAVLDTAGNFVTRIPNPEKFVGHRQNEQLREQILAETEGASEITALDGVPILNAFSRSPVTGWTVSIAIPLQTLEAARRTPFYSLLASVTVFFILLFALAGGIGNKISRAIHALVEPAQRLGQGDPVTPTHVEIKETAEVGQALVHASEILRQRTEALEAERNGRLLQLEQMVAERTQELMAATRQAESLARRDALTGLLNRLASNERLREEFLRTKRTGETYSALILDIDHFKQINDTYGHETGDQVLKTVAEVLEGNVRTTDFVFRYGGEEFLALLPNTGLEGAQVIGEKLRAAVESHLFGSWLQITVSVGVSVAKATDANEHEALRRADAALYLAKNGGRNQVQFA